MAIRSKNEYLRKNTKLESLRNEIECLKQQISEYYDLIMKNQDLYIEGYLDSLRCNSSLGKEMKKCEWKLRKLECKYNTLYSELRGYQY